MCSGVALEDTLRENSIDIAEETFLQLKYDPASVWGYVEVNPCKIYCHANGK